MRLDGLPNTLAHGHEVTVNFHSDVENNQVFYTDSNGLELQERMLNYRPDYEVDIMKGGLNVTANFYPINSAITLEDAATDLKMAVVNDRAQAGSVLETGRVELMMNRRIFKDDDRGVNQPLNECNAKQVGITVSGEYAIQLTTGKLQHRAIQKMFDQPQQQFFAFGSNFVASHTASMLTEAGLGICYEH